MGPGQNLARLDRLNELTTNGSRNVLRSECVRTTEWAQLADISVREFVTSRHVLGNVETAAGKAIEDFVTVMLASLLVHTRDRLLDTATGQSRLGHTDLCHVTREFLCCNGIGIVVAPTGTRICDVLLE